MGSDLICQSINLFIHHARTNQIELVSKKVPEFITGIQARYIKLDIKRPRYVFFNSAHIPHRKSTPFLGKK